MFSDGCVSEVASDCAQTLVSHVCDKFDITNVRREANQVQVVLELDPS